MPIFRNHFVGLLFAALALGVQPAQAGQAQAANHTVITQTAPRARRTPHPARGSYEITITFKRVYHGKLATDKSYTLLTTVGSLLPAIRDDDHYRTSANCTDPACTIEGATDVDILKLEPQGRSIYVALRISTKTMGINVPEFLPRLPVSGSHQYLITPTVPIGKLVTVYSQINGRADTDVELQLLVKPHNPSHSDSLP